MGKIRVEFVPIKKFNLGLLGLDHLQIVFEDENSAINTQENWYVLEGTHDGGLLDGTLGVIGEEFHTELAAANATGLTLLEAIGTPEARGSRVVYEGPDALARWDVMMDYGKEIQAQEFPYEGLTWPFRPGAIINSSSVIATLLYVIGIDVNIQMPYGIRLSPGTATLLGTTGDDDITIRNNFTQVAGGIGEDTLRGTETAFWPEKFFGGLDDDHIVWSKGENFIHGGEPRLAYAMDGKDTVDYSGGGHVTIMSNHNAIEHKVADFIATFDGGTDKLFSIEAIDWNRESDVITVGEGVDLLEQAIELNLDDAAVGKGDQLGFLGTTAPLIINAIDSTMISVQTMANQGLDAGYWANSVEWIAGSAGDDLIYAGATLRGVEGGGGNDLLDGRLAPLFAGDSLRGYDIELDGGDGNDTLVSGLGRSIAAGGAGSDKFVLSNLNVGLDYTEFVIEDANAEDALYVPYDFFKSERGDFEGSELFQLRGAPFKLTATQTTSSFYWGLPDENEVQGFIDFVGLISYSMEGADLIISVMYGHAEEHLKDNGPNDPPGPLLTSVVGEGLSESFIRVIDWQEGDLGITFPLTFNVADFANAGGLPNYPGFAEAIQNAVDASAFIAPLDTRPDAYLPQDLAAGAAPLAIARTVSPLAADAPATEGDDIIALTTGGPYTIVGLGGNDTLTGSNGGDVIDGGSGDDMMAGGRGNDTYFIDSAGDTIVEETRGGFDHVYSAVNYTLGSELEHLTLLGTALTGTGNALRNTLAGNAHDNILIAGTGDDTLAGNGGNDELSGGSGSDGYVYEFGDGDDVILEVAGDLGEDLIVFVGQILPEEMAFFRDPAALDDLILRFLGGGSITITDYFATTGTTIEGFDFDAGPDWDTAEIGQHAATAILSANTGPIAADDSYVFAGANTFRLPVAALLENDSDRDGDQLSIISVTSSEGTAHIEGGEVVVTANAETTPRAVFDYIVSDSHGGTHTATVEISFWPNSAPVITSSELAVVAANTEATGLIVATDADGDALFYTVQTGAEPAKGTIAFAADGAFSYTPFANASGADAFTVLVSDTFGASAAHTFNVLIPSTNRAPEIISATLDPISEDTPANGVLVATDGDGDVLTYSIKAGGEPQKGSVVLAAGGTFTYSPSANANGSDSFTLVVTDTAGASAEKAFDVSIAAVNDAPSAVNDTGFALVAGSSITIDGEQLLANDNDVDGDNLTIVSAGTAIGGTVALDQSGNLVFTASANFSGQAAFTYGIADGQGGSASASVSLTVSPVTTPVGLVLKGTNHRDTLVGTQYHDVFYGKKGADILMGLGGDDVFVVKGDDGTDWIDGGEGHDSILGSTRNDTIGVSWNLGNLRSIEAILGGSGFDRIVATDGNDVLDFSGLTLQGIDRISLGDGNDRVKGSNSNDIFSGGDGRDTFVLTRDAGRDTIVDFDARQHGRTGDSIDVTAFQFANFAAVSSRMHQYGHNVVITLDAETSLTLKDVHIRDLGASDFRIL